MFKQTRGSYMRSNEIIFDVRQSPEGGYEARALGHSIFTEADDWEQLKEMVRDAVLCHFEDDEMPRMVRIHMVHDEVILV